MTTTERPTIDLTGLVLYSGSHAMDEARCCFEEASAILGCALRDPNPPATWAEAYERFLTCKTDYPDTDSWAVAAIMRRLNDWSGWKDDTERTLYLLPYELKVAGSLMPQAVEMKRALLAVDWGLREKLAEVCDLTEQSEHAMALRALAPLDSAATIRAATPTVRLAALAVRAALAVLADRAALAVLADLADRAALAVLAARADRADLAALAELADLADRAALAELAARADRDAYEEARRGYIVDMLGLVDRMLAVTE